MTRREALTRVQTYTVVVTDRAGSVQHQQPFVVADLPDARERAIKHGDNCKRTFPDCKVQIALRIDAENREQLAEILGYVNLDDHGTVSEIKRVT